MYQIALTGGVAAGKSLVARRLAELGAVVIDADVLAREVVEPGTPGLGAIRARFGDGVIAADGSLDRPALGTIVFADPEARAALNGITHPAIIARRRELMAALPLDAIVVQDIPLLVETVPDARERYDAVLVVHADEEDRIERMTRARGWTREEAVRRIRSQAAEEERLAIATRVIDNTGSREATLAQVDAFWDSIPR
ncbi:dephospho-CoA kinase [Galbitalea sp. SE-J8]|uniref:dephospho-CoA kinase n=1 Tax=Galbitalea sp. SE-J8 TaxID=3054952 RepID=UPI00259D2FFE|nr:dephospho-CoA kinase [Galbitalea sp. SE-J8]MDM4763101.1 dephospho-CoA kinase [Galbitalea sp. SE-J8]